MTMRCARCMGICRAAPVRRAARAASRRADPWSPSGGAPGGSELRRPAGFRPGARPPPYPEGVDAPAKRFYTGYGLSYPFILSPPWSSLVAYDLNTRHDQVARAARRGSRRRRPKARRARACRADRSAWAWSSPRPASSSRRRATARCARSTPTPARRSGPAICRTAPRAFRRCMPINGRQYLVVSATTTLVWGRKSLGGSEPWVKKDASTPPGGYVVFALPEKGTEESAVTRSRRQFTKTLAMGAGRGIRRRRRRP